MEPADRVRELLKVLPRMIRELRPGEKPGRARGLRSSRSASIASSVAFLPNLGITPGTIEPAVTDENIDETICVSGYSWNVRSPRSYTGDLKGWPIRAQHPGGRLRDCKLDHLISLPMGDISVDVADAPLDPW